MLCSIFIYCELITSILTFTPLQIECYFFIDAKIVHIDPVFAEIYSSFWARFFKAGASGKRPDLEVKASRILCVILISLKIRIYKTNCQSMDMIT